MFMSLNPQFHADTLYLDADKIMTKFSGKVYFFHIAF